MWCQCDLRCAPTNGDASTALSDPNTIVITEAMAEKYFRGGDPIGKVLTIDPKERDREGNLNGNTYDFTISAIMANVPERSHFRFDFLLPSSILNDVYGGDINGEADINPWYWRGLIGYTYLELKPGTDVDAFAAKFEAFQERYVGDATRANNYRGSPGTTGSTG